MLEHGIDNWTVTIFPEGLPPGNRAPIARTDSIVVERESSTDIFVLANDSDPNGDSLSIIDHTTPKYGQLVFEDIDFFTIVSLALRAEAVTGVEPWQDTLRSLVDGEGSAIITQGQLDVIDSFLNNLHAPASSDLQKIIDDERTRLGPPGHYVGLTVKEAKTKAIGDPAIYHPLVINQ